MIAEITIDEALKMENTLLLDVRSEGEFNEDTIPGAVNVPVLNNEERAMVGTLYRQDGPVPARRLALELVAPKLPSKIAAVNHIATSDDLIVFCWRGGERSRFMAAVLDTMGYDVYRIKRGYKSYRRYVNEYLKKEKLTQTAVVLHGLTGVGKTEVLELLGQKGLPVLDLEGLARHRGSVYGKIGLPPSPKQKAFESEIVKFLSSIDKKGIFIVECESKRVGNLIVPLPLMNSIRNGIRVLLYAPLAERVSRIRNIYTDGPAHNVEELQEATLSLVKRLGRARVEELNKMLEERNFEPVFAYLLTKYYDPLYKYPDGPSEEYDCSIDTSDVEKAAIQILNFVTGLPEYKSYNDKLS
ncbi:MAG: tRNA 2-selenouridine(34) synthase MnmH [Desulfotomaculaceae bacterium]|nr:tRNA 2-selenouridine(34) synthase MnmH [Desulfotomaculaceae bacterium]MDD4765970.1 tRNA 2-selenouridine(34) synthase MnmH [Desulfotomaculaceae bacterium]